MTNEVADQAVRLRALDPRGSFIVQAPAGSGKTGLLTQRYLRLLATVEAPEEIIAMTFTLKAAGEMRNRILEALQAAAQPVAPAEAHARRTWELARAALARDAERGWQLAAHPARLHIQTVDSLNSELVRQMPLLSGLGAPPRIAGQPEALYMEAARRTLAMLDSGGREEAGPLAVLLAHLDNDVPRAATLLSGMLARRDRWLRLVGSGRAVDPGRLEQFFRNEIVHQLQGATAAMPAELKPELVELVAFAARALRLQGKESALVACEGLQEFPGTSADVLPVWQGLAELLLTKETHDAWRKIVNKNQGFDTDHREEKAHMIEVLQRLQPEHRLHNFLQCIRGLPRDPLDAAQQQVLVALLVVLPLAVAQLMLVFAERGEADFAEVSLRALHALGEAEAPTDLALALDYRIRHLLVDEFQDTSFNQFQLLERLTAGWQPDDGRSLFVVGDPMQSIYRFREAEVGLFLRAQQQGIGTVPLTPLTLSVNFRSRPQLVIWVNTAFAQVFPRQDDMVSGALTYKTCNAARASTPDAQVEVHCAFAKDPENEARQIIEVIRAAHAAGQKVAVLVRGRGQLLALVPRLRREGLRFQAMELEQLGERPVVRDLMSLTRLLLHAGDRTAWLAALRAPWCGLTLADLLVLAGENHERTLTEVLTDETCLAELSDDGQARFVRVCGVLRHALGERRRGSLRAQVEHLWFQLGGPAVCTSGEDLADAEAFLALLESVDEGGTISDLGVLEDALAHLFAQPDPEAEDKLQLMTIHKAKGLEFDAVIVPGLGAGTRHADAPLLLYLERTRAAGAPDLLLAPLNARGTERDAHYQTVLALRAEQEDYERQRLLYVAATRAREALHLFGHVTYMEKDGQRDLRGPRGDSLLASLWPAVEKDFLDAWARYTPAAVDAEESRAPVRLRRVPSGWQPPAPPADVPWKSAGALAAPPETALEFEWAGDTLRHVGTVVHRILFELASRAEPPAELARRVTDPARVRGWLEQAGVPQAELANAVQIASEAVARMLADPVGQKILAARGPDARCEYALSGFEDGRLVTGVMDRTFVDQEGVCWIVDYKTSRHAGGEREEFFAREAERYRPQLARYVRLMRAYQSRPVKAGLYFPLLGEFLEVEAENK